MGECSSHSFKERGWVAAGLVEWCRCGKMNILISFTGEARKCALIPTQAERREFIRQFQEAHGTRRGERVKALAETYFHQQRRNK